MTPSKGNLNKLLHVCLKGNLAKALTLRFGLKDHQSVPVHSVNFTLTVCFHVADDGVRRQIESLTAWFPCCTA